MKKESPFLVIKRTYKFIYFTGVFLIAAFTLIFFIAAIIMGQLNFYSMFFHNIHNHIFLTVLAGLHVAMLCVGILFIIFAFYNMTLELKFYKDNMSVSLFLQKAKFIKYSDIRDVNVRVCFFRHDKHLNKNKKECRVTFNNNIHTFYISYNVVGYYDDIEMYCKRNRDDISKRAIASQDSALKLLHHLRKNYKMAVPYLPSQLKIINLKGNKN